MEEEHIYSTILDNYVDHVSPRCGNTYVSGDRNIQSSSGEYESPEWREEDMVNSQQEKDTKVFCTYCIPSCVPAVKSCLRCEASLCLIHLELHSKSREHLLTAPNETFRKAEDLQCSIHKRALKYYCFEDATCICSSCHLAGIHTKHQVEPLSEASEKKKKDLKNVLEKSIMQQMETDMEVKNLQNKRKAVKQKASNLSDRISRLFGNVRNQLDNLELRVLNEIVKEEDEVSEQISLLVEKLEQQRDELSRNIRFIEELCDLSDPLTILRKTDEKQADFWSPKRKQSSLCDPEDLDEGLILANLQRSLEDIMTNIKRWHGESEVTLDVTTAANNVYISGDRKYISWSKINQSRQKSLKRFKSYQVMSTQRFSSGQHYWEIDTSPSGKWTVGVCYPSMDRKGERSFIGNNNKSWGLGCIDKIYKVVHDRRDRLFPNQLTCNKIGIYLDYAAGQVSFYEVSEVIRHIHTFTTTFTEPLHAVFWVWFGWMRVNT